MAITGQEKKEFNNMVIACGRSPGDFDITEAGAGEGGDIITVENRHLGRKKDYVKDSANNWVIQFATDLKLGEM